MSDQFIDTLQRPDLQDWLANNFEGCSLGTKELFVLWAGAAAKRGIDMSPYEDLINALSRDLGCTALCGIDQFTEPEN